MILDVISTVARLLVVAVLALPAQTKPELDSLRGLSEFLVIAGVSRVLADAGFTNEQIQTDVELRLRKAGLTVVAEDVMLAPWKRTAYDAETERLLKRAQALAQLVVEARCFPVEEGLLSYRIRIEVRQAVTTTRKVGLLATTWEYEELGAVGRLKASSLRSTVADVVDRFLNAYLAANPK